MNSQRTLLLVGSTIDASLTVFGMRLHFLILMRSVRTRLFIGAGGGAGAGAGGDSIGDQASE